MPDSKKKKDVTEDKAASKAKTVNDSKKVSYGNLNEMDQASTEENTSTVAEDRGPLQKNELELREGLGFGRDITLDQTAVKTDTKAKAK